MNKKNSQTLSNTANHLNEMSEYQPSPNEDVMIKLVRVLANLAINEQAGTLLATRADLFEILLKILGKHFTL